MKDDARHEDCCPSLSRSSIPGTTRILANKNARILQLPHKYFNRNGVELWEFAPRCQSCEGGGGRSSSIHAGCWSKRDDEVGTGHLGQNKDARYLAAGSSRRLFLSARRRGGKERERDGGARGVRTKQRNVNVTFDVSPEMAEMAAHCLDYKLIRRSIARRARGK